MSHYHHHFVSGTATLTIGWPNLSLTFSFFLCCEGMIGRNLFFMMPGPGLSWPRCALGGLMVARPESPLSCQEKTLPRFLSPLFSRLPSLPGLSCWCVRPVACLCAASLTITWEWITCPRVEASTRPSRM